MKKKIIIFSLILLLLVLVGGGVYFYNKNKVRTTAFNVISLDVDTAFKNGDLGKAIDLLDQSLKKNPNDTSTLLALSISWAQRGSLEYKENEYGQKALDYAKQVLKMDSNNIKGYIALGYADEIMGDFKGAIESYNRALALDGNNVDAIRHRGHAYDLSGDLAKAEIDYIKADSLDSTNLDVKMNLGRLYIRQAKINDAKINFLTVANSVDNARVKAEAYYNLSLIEIGSTSTSSLKMAFDYASSSISADPTYPQAYAVMGNVYIKKGDNTKALEFLDKAISIYPNLSYALGLIADVYAKEGNIEKTIQAYEVQKKAALVDIGLMQGVRSLIISHADLKEAIFYTKNNKKEEAVTSLKIAMDVSKDPVNDLNILFLTLDKNAGGKFNNLLNYQPYKDLVEQFKEKIKAGFLKPRNEVSHTPPLLMQKLLSIFNIKKAIAYKNVAGMCGSVGDKFFYDNEGNYDGFEFTRIACDIFIAYYSGNTSFNYSSAFGTLYSYTASWDNYLVVNYASYIGCSNGWGIAVAIAPPKPELYSGSCSTNTGGSTANFSWKNATGYDTVYFRAVDMTLDPTGTNQSLYKESIKGSSYSFTAVLGHSYKWWIHTREYGTDFWSPAVGSSFVCPPHPAPPTNATSSCSANGGTANFSWTNASDYRNIYFRAVDTTLHPGAVYGTNIPDLFNESVPGSSYSFNTVPGHSYVWWINTRSSTDDRSTEIVSGNFKCTLTPPTPSAPTITGPTDVTLGVPAIYTAVSHLNPVAKKENTSFLASIIFSFKKVFAQAAVETKLIYTFDWNNDGAKVSTSTAVLPGVSVQASNTWSTKGTTTFRVKTTESAGGASSAWVPVTINVSDKPKVQALFYCVSPNLSWNAVPNAISYDFEVKNKTDLTSVHKTITGTTVDISQYLNNTNISFGVRAIYSGNIMGDQTWVDNIAPACPKLGDGLNIKNGMIFGSNPPWANATTKKCSYYGQIDPTIVMSDEKTYSGIVVNACSIDGISVSLSNTVNGGKGFEDLPKNIGTHTLSCSVDFDNGVDSNGVVKKSNATAILTSKCSSLGDTQER